MLAGPDRSGQPVHLA